MIHGLYSLLEKAEFPAVGAILLLEETIASGTVAESTSGTTLVSNQPCFHSAMVGGQLVIEDSTFTIVGYTSTTQVTLGATGAANYKGKRWSTPGRHLLSWGAGAPSGAMHAVFYFRTDAPTIDTAFYTHNESGAWAAATLS